MTTRLRAGAATSLALGALLAGASVLVGASAAQAAPQALPVQVSFTDLVPGDVRSTSWPVHVAERAKVARAMLQQDGDGVRWTASLCPTSGTTACLDVLAVGPGTRVAAGEYVLSVGLIATTDLEPGQSRGLEAHYTLVQDEDGVLADTSGPFGGGHGRGRSLALTGSPALPLAVTALAVTALGVLLVVLARRRRDGDETDTREPA